MKRLITTVCAGVACSVAAMGAQSPTTAPQGRQDAMKSGTVTVTGCVTAGTTADQFMLTKATTSHDSAMKHDGMAPGDKTGAYGADKPGADKPGAYGEKPGATADNRTPADRDMAGMDKMNAEQSYVLSGGTNLKAHVGHKIEVTGTIDKSQSVGTSGSTSPTDPTAKADSMGKDSKTQTLKVQTVKMVSASCQ